MKGYRRRNLTKDTWSPIKLSKLFNITNVICSSEFEVILFNAVFSIVFFAAFRISELLSPSKVGRSGILLSNVLLFDDSLRIYLKYSETDSLGLGSWISLNGCRDECICPVKILKSYINIRPGLSELLFIHCDGSTLTIYQFKSVLKRCLPELKLSNLHITTHSFRIGTASGAARIGLEAKSIKKIGRWSSDSYCTFVHINSLLCFTVGNCRMVWILGHSFIFWVQKRAAARDYSENLGLDLNSFVIVVKCC